MQWQQIEVDRKGIPLYDGDPKNFEEYAERAWDVYYGRSGQDAHQAATPVNLRGGLSSTAYDPVRKLRHIDLITLSGEGTQESPKRPDPAGMQLFLNTLSGAIAIEKPVRAAELFEKTLYEPTVWRQPGESMSQYTVRRNVEFEDLKLVSPDTAISSDLQAFLLLKFSGIPKNSRAGIISSANNKYDKDKFVEALRMQHSSIQTDEKVARKPVAPRRAQGHIAEEEEQEQDEPASDTPDEGSLSTPLMRNFPG